VRGGLLVLFIIVYYVFFLTFCFAAVALYLLLIPFRFSHIYREYNKSHNDMQKSTQSQMTELSLEQKTELEHLAKHTGTKIEYEMSWIACVSVCLID
jgi:hypothetical protein